MSDMAARGPPRQRESLLTHIEKNEGIIDTLVNSSFGSFNKALENIRPLIPGIRLTLPRVVVVGSRDAGKSSLLENITKCAIFPRDKGVCTRMPIKFHLQQVQSQEASSCVIIYKGVRTPVEFVDDVLSKVTSTMKEVGTFSKEELVIELKQVNVPTFDFVDLPGIQSVPEKDRLQTEGLVKSYIADPNTLVLCVLAATDAALDQGTALKLVIDANKLDSTVVALTKSDWVHEDNIEDHIFKRILRCSETSPAQLKGLKGCVAVVNRTQKDSALTLEQAADKEFSFFAKMLHEAEGKYKEAAVQHQLSAGMTSKQLMVMLNEMYHAHITGKWVEATLATISREQGKIKKSLDDLGGAPETLRKDDVMASLSRKVDFPYICQEVADNALANMFDLSVPSFKGNAGLYGDQLLGWAEETILCEAAVKSSLNTALTSAKYLKTVCAAYNSAFDSDPQLKRLDTFHSMMTSGHGTLHSLVTEALLEAKLDVDMLAKTTMEQLLFSTDTSILRTLCNKVSRCIAKHVIRHVKTRPISIPSSFDFTEDDQTAKTRADLMQKLDNFEKAAVKVSNIGREFLADNHADQVLQSLLSTARALSPKAASEEVFGPQPARISTAAAALYDDVDLHDSESPASGQSAQIHAELEGTPVSPVASDFSFIE